MDGGAGSEGVKEESRGGEEETGIKKLTVSLRRKSLSRDFSGAAGDWQLDTSALFIKQMRCCCQSKLMK